MPVCEILAIGNELLQGDVLDTNTHWLIQQITAIGGFIGRTAMLRDDGAAIVGALQDASERKVDLIITSGGLGPTDDDLTLEAVSVATGCPLELCPEAREMVAETYRVLAARGLFPDADMTPAREKMARLPQGAIPLANSAGAAPGVLLSWENSRIVCLPGVPGELKAIYSESLRPILRGMFGESTFIEWCLTADCADESLLAPVLAAVQRQHTEVYIKSRARRLGIDLTFDITLSCSGVEVDQLEAALRSAATELQAALVGAGIPVLDITQR